MKEALLVLFVLALCAVCFIPYPLYAQLPGGASPEFEQQQLTEEMDSIARDQQEKKKSEEPDVVVVDEKGKTQAAPGCGCGG